MKSVTCSIKPMDQIVMNIQNKIETVELRDLFHLDKTDDLLLSLPASPMNSFSSNELPIVYSYEQMTLAYITKAIKPRRILEFGTGQGTGTLLLAANAPPESMIYTVDLDAQLRGDYTSKILRGDNDVGLAYKASEFSSRITQFLVSSNEPVETFSQLKSSLDFIFIDGDHSYNGVRHDTMIAIELLNENGILLWHDFYTFESYISEGKDKRGVFPWLNELAKEFPLNLYHISGTYMVVACRQWPKKIPARLIKLDDRKHPFSTRIVRQGEA